MTPSGLTEALVIAHHQLFQGHFPLVIALHAYFSSDLFSEPTIILTRYSRLGEKKGAKICLLAPAGLLPLFNHATLRNEATAR